VNKRILPLTALKNGETAIIVSIDSPSEKEQGRWGLKKRLMNMGLTPGTKITVVKSAPFHGPIEIIVRDTRLALGRGIAERILVEVEE
jgi:Fe2+ transport system protein FeoA